MRKIFSAAIPLAVILISACGGHQEQAPAQPTALNFDGAVKAAESKLIWKGEMLGIKYHEGTVALTDGKLTIKDGALAGGMFNIDMKSMVATDANYDAASGYTSEKLIGHLGSADFFAVDSFPTSSFTITSVTGNTAKGNLTVRGRTNEETVNEIAIDTTGGQITVSGNVVFNRQKYGVAWASPMKDMVLSDDITIKVALKL
jgi:polyisoprenoid-binding protein YceI